MFYETTVVENILGSMMALFGLFMSVIFHPLSLIYLSSLRLFGNLMKLITKITAILSFEHSSVGAMKVIYVFVVIEPPRDKHQRY
jgi:hypothetical protein